MISARSKGKMVKFSESVENVAAFKELDDSPSNIIETE